MTDETVPTLEQAIHDAPPGTFFDFDVKLAPEVEPVAAYLAENGLTEHGSLKIDVFSEEEVAEHLAKVEHPALALDPLM